jgi:hypothetical protein
MDKPELDALLASLNPEMLAAHLLKLAAAQPATRRDAVPLMNLIEALLEGAGLGADALTHAGARWGATERLRRALLPILPGVPGVRHVEADA